MLQEDECNCQVELESCKDAYIEAYKCYLLNKESPNKCIKEFKAMKECQQYRTPMQKLKEKLKTLYHKKIRNFLSK